MKKESMFGGLQCSPEMTVFLKFDEKGLIPAIVQDHRSREILMMAYVSRESLDITCRKGLATFWSRSRQTLWTKGETSGNWMRVLSIQMDCDGDTLILWVDPQGPACHTGKKTCFYRILASRPE